MNWLRLSWSEFVSLIGFALVAVAPDPKGAAWGITATYVVVRIVERIVEKT